jgi:hypothetical protein
MDEDELAAIETISKNGEYISPETVLALVANYRLLKNAMEETKKTLQEIQQLTFGEK